VSLCRVLFFLWPSGHKICPPSPPPNSHSRFLLHLQIRVTTYKTHFSFFCPSLNPSGSEAFFESVPLQFVTRLLPSVPRTVYPSPFLSTAGLAWGYPPSFLQYTISDRVAPPLLHAQITRLFSRRAFFLCAALLDRDVSRTYVRRYFSSMFV